MFGQLTCTKDHRITPHQTRDMLIFSLTIFHETDATHMASSRPGNAPRSSELANERMARTPPRASQRADINNAIYHSDPRRWRHMHPSGGLRQPHGNSASQAGRTSPAHRYAWRCMLTQTLQTCADTYRSEPRRAQHQPI